MKSDLRLSIGGVAGSLALEGPAPEIRRIQARYAPFRISDVRTTFSLDLDLGATRGAWGGAEAGRVLARGGNLKIARSDFLVSLALKGSRWSGRGRCEADPFSFDSLLRVLWSAFLPREGGFLLHACGLRRGGEGWVFPGQSGAGKSTLARKMKDPRDVLSDELTAVRRGEGGAWRVTATPFFGEFRSGRGGSQAWPLAGIAFLGRAKELRVVPISPAASTHRLMGTILCFETDPEAVLRNLALAAALCGEVPCCEAKPALRTRPETLFQALRPKEKIDEHERERRVPSRGRLSLSKS